LKRSTPVDAFRVFYHLNLTNIDEDTRFPATIIQTLLHNGIHVCCKDGNNSPTTCQIYTTRSALQHLDFEDAIQAFERPNP
jgi:hypothetical protein